MKKLINVMIVAIMLCGNIASAQTSLASAINDAISFKKSTTPGYRPTVYIDVTITEGSVIIKNTSKLVVMNLATKKSASLGITKEYLTVSNQPYSVGTVTNASQTFTAETSSSFASNAVTDLMSITYKTNNGTATTIIGIPKTATTSLLASHTPKQLNDTVYRKYDISTISNNKTVKVTLTLENVLIGG